MPSPAEDRFERIRSAYPPILTAHQVAELLGVSHRTVLSMAVDGRLPAIRLPGARKFQFFLDEVLDVLERHRVVPGSDEAEELAAAEQAEPEPAPAPAKKRGARVREPRSAGPAAGARSTRRAKKG